MDKKPKDTKDPKEVLVGVVPFDGFHRLVLIDNRAELLECVCGVKALHPVLISTHILGENLITLGKAIANDKEL